MQPEQLERLKATLADRYAIEREVGRGGMATVYLAEDLKHRRKVAIKVLKPEIAVALGPERFLREIEIAAKLTHPHILPLYDSSEADGFLYYVMPYVEGESLRDRLTREKQLPVEEAVRLAHDVAAALSHAHRCGVVHRDIKPENILLEGGEAVVADFGIARAVSVAGRERLTDTGIAVGTPAYMSPEQVTGDHELDSRSDLYSLGCVLYEMLAGHPPFTGATSQEILLRHATDPVPPLRAARPSIAEAVEQVVLRTLAKAPVDRFTTAAELAQALHGAVSGEAPIAPRARRRRWRTVAVAVTLGLIVLVAAAYALVPPATRATVLTVLTRPDATLNPRRIVVAPFDNRTGDPNLDALGEMAAGWIADALLQTTEFEVVDARTALVSARIAERIPWILRNSDMAIAVAEETGAGVAVSGNVYRVGGALQIQVRITDAVSNKLLRTLEPVTASPDAMSEPLDILAEQTLVALALGTDTTVAGGGVRHPRSYEAYKAVSAGWERYFGRDYEGFFTHTNRALSMDSLYITALLMQAHVLLDVGLWHEAAPVIGRLQRHRERLTPGEHAVLDAQAPWLDGDLPAHLRGAQRMLRYFPGSAEAPLLAARAAVWVGRPQEALEALAGTDPQRGLNLVSPFYWLWRCSALHQLGQHELELEAAQRARRQFPSSRTVSNITVSALAALGRVKELDAILSEVREPRPPSRYVAHWLTFVLQWLDLHAVRELRWHGHDVAAQRVLDRALSSRQTESLDAAPSRERFVHGELLYEGGRWDEARSIFNQLVTDEAFGVAARGYLGAIAARVGERAVAQRIAAELAALRRPYLHGQHTLWRAHIAAALGDRDEAVRLLHSAFRQGTSHGFGHAHRDFLALRDHPPFQQLMAAKD